MRIFDPLRVSRTPRSFLLPPLLTGAQLGNELIGLPLVFGDPGPQKRTLQGQEGPLGDPTGSWRPFRSRSPPRALHRVLHPHNTLSEPAWPSSGDSG